MRRRVILAVALSIAVGGVVYSLAMSVIYFSALKPIVVRRLGRRSGT